MRRKKNWIVGLVCLLLPVSILLYQQQPEARDKDDFEVWVTDQSRTAGRIYINSGAFTGNPDEADLYSFPADVASYSSPLGNTPARTLIYSFDGANPVNDSHGMTLVSKKDRFLWVDDRAANETAVVKTKTDSLITTFSLVSKHSADPTPDLMASDPKGKQLRACDAGRRTAVPVSESRNDAIRQAVPSLLANPSCRTLR